MIAHIACKCAGTCNRCQLVVDENKRRVTALNAIAGLQSPLIGNDRIKTLQQQSRLTPGEEIELKMLLERKWK